VRGQWPAAGAPVFSRRTSAASSIVPINSASGAGRDASRRTHLLTFDAQLDLRDVGPEEQGHRPVEDDAQTAVPARHLKQVVRPPHPPGRKTGEPHAEDERHGARVTERRHGPQRVEHKRTRDPLFDRRLDVARQLSRLPGSVLRERRIRPSIGTRDGGTIAERPDIGDSNPVQREQARRPNRTPAKRMNVIPIRSGNLSLPYGVTDMTTGAGRSPGGLNTLTMSCVRLAPSRRHRGQALAPPSITLLFIASSMKTARGVGRSATRLLASPRRTRDLCDQRVACVARLPAT
jgi:hypothetical protein